MPPMSTSISDRLGDYVTDHELAEMLGVSRKTITRYSDQVDGMPYVRLGRRRLYDLGEVRRWLAEREVRRNRRRVAA